MCVDETRLWVCNPIGLADEVPCPGGAYFTCRGATGSGTCLPGGDCPDAELIHGESHCLTDGPYLETCINGVLQWDDCGSYSPGWMCRHPEQEEPCCGP